MTVGQILIVGGYGDVGRRISAELAPSYPGRVVVAGRTLASGIEAASAIGFGARARLIDTSTASAIGSALDGAAIVISCIDLPNRMLLWAAIERGLKYTDITPRLTELGNGEAYEKIVAAARASGARVILGTGIAPGIANVMARRLFDSLGGADEIETALLLPVGDTGGPALFEYFLQELAMSYRIRVDGEDRPARPFSSSRPIDFPPPAGVQRAYLFPFSDQVLYCRTLGARTAVTRLAVDPAWIGRILSTAVRLGVSRLTAVSSVRRVIARVRRQLARPSSAEPRFELRVDVKHGDRMRCATLIGRSQADATALAAAETARLLIDGYVTTPGAWMPEQVVDPTAFLSRLAARGLKVEFRETAGEYVAPK